MSLVIPWPPPESLCDCSMDSAPSPFPGLPARGLCWDVQRATGRIPWGSVLPAQCPEGILGDNYHNSSQWLHRRDILNSQHAHFTLLPPSSAQPLQLTAQLPAGLGALLSQGALPQKLWIRALVLQSQTGTKSICCVESFGSVPCLRPLVDKLSAFCCVHTTLNRA